MRGALAAVVAGRTLSEDEAEAAFEIIMSGDATPSQIGGFLTALALRGETVDELAGAARVMRARAIRVQAPDGAIDTCGTGGDGKGTLNISTAAALVVAACGVPVAKHGNRAMSSRSGSADVLTACGVDLECDLGLMTAALRELKFGFFLAPRHHLATRNVAPFRVELGFRTIFNLLGPLSSPALCRRQLVGTFDRRWVEPFARVLGRLGAERAWAVHGSDGLDELTITGPSEVAEWHDGALRLFSVTPADAGLKTATLDAIGGGDAVENAQALRALLAGREDAYRDIVLLNAAAALVVAGRTGDLKTGAALAASAIDRGHGARLLDALIKWTHRPPPDRNAAGGEENRP